MTEVVSASLEQTKVFKVEGMSCASCVARVEKIALQIPGVRSASVGLLTESAKVTFDQNVINDAEIVLKLTEGGYKTTLLSNEVSHRQLPTESSVKNSGLSALWQFDGEEGIRKSLVVSAVLTLPLLLPMIFPALSLNGWIQLIVSAPVQFWIGKRFYVSALKSMKTLNPNMDVLVTLGTTAAWGLSFYFLIFDHFAAETMKNAGSERHFYFETSAAVITFMVLGRCLEQKARKRTGEALTALQNLVPETVTVLLEEDKIEKRSLSEVTKNTLFLVKNGERVPLDGLIQTGHSSVNESQVTGESLPVQKSPGDSVRAGSLLLEGTITALSTSDSKNSTIGRIISLVEHAQASKAPIQKLVDKVCAVFVPVVLVIALGTWIGWWMASGDLSRAIMNAVAVLVIACPCALGLATPSAIVVGIGEAAKKGILVRDPAVLETAHKVTIALLDKTGTLTEGKPEVKSLKLETDSLRSLLFRVSALNSHPLSAALSGYFLQNPEPNDRSANSEDLKLVSIPGKGMLADFNAAQYFFGNLRAAVEGGFSKDDLKKSKFSNEIDIANSRGATVSFLFELDNDSSKHEQTNELNFSTASLVGFVSFEDRIKPNSKTAVKELKRRNIETMLITGDNNAAAHKVAKQVEVDWLQSEVLPAGKLKAIEELRKKKHIVAMVGDGINDSPALSAADVSIAFASGSDSAVFSAGITLMDDNPLLVITALDIAKKTYSKIQQNLFWAFGFNVLAIPLAAAGLLNPAVAGGAMALSSFFVVTNSLRLKRSLANI